MNNRLICRVLLYLSAAVAGLVFAGASPAQTAVWRYVATLPDAGKTYINDDGTILAGGRRKTAWQKTVAADGSFFISLSEWNCRAKLRLTRQITSYGSDQSVIDTKRSGFAWTRIIPGSAGDFLYRRICLPAPPVIRARIIADMTLLRVFPGDASRTARVANRGELFAVIPETGQNNWYNLVDEKTQEDYWLAGDDFKKIVEKGKTGESETAAAGDQMPASAKTRISRKPSKRASPFRKKLK